MPAVNDTVWTAENTTPAEIEAALRELLAERHAESAAYVPARVLNLVCVVDRQWSGEIAHDCLCCQRATHDTRRGRHRGCGLDPDRRRSGADVRDDRDRCGY
jgi:hypothetical protein